MARSETEPPGSGPPSGRPRRYDAGFHERVRLRDGREVTLRLVGPDDAPLLERGFLRLSSESRYRRFLSAKPRLTRQEVAYLTHVDGDRHFALGAVEQRPDGSEEGLGVARFVRLADPHAAEAAVTVLDDVQGLGLGTVLLEHLVEAARERAIERFECLVLAGNDAMRELLHAVAPGSVDRPEGREIVVVSPLPAPGPRAAARHVMYDVLARAAAGDLEVTPHGLELGLADTDLADGGS